MNHTNKITIVLPAALQKKLENIQKHLSDDIQPGESVPSIEDLIIDAVAEAYGEDDESAL